MPGIDRLPITITILSGIWLASFNYLFTIVEKLPLVQYEMITTKDETAFETSVHLKNISQERVFENLKVSIRYNQHTAGTLIDQGSAMEEVPPYGLGDPADSIAGVEEKSGEFSIPILQPGAEVRIRVRHNTSEAPGMLVYLAAGGSENAAITLVTPERIEAIIMRNIFGLNLLIIVFASAAIGFYYAIKGLDGEGDKT